MALENLKHAGNIDSIRRLISIIENILKVEDFGNWRVKATFEAILMECYSNETDTNKPHNIANLLLKLVRCLLSQVQFYPVIHGSRRGEGRSTQKT